MIIETLGVKQEMNRMNSLLKSLFRDKTIWRTRFALEKYMSIQLLLFDRWMQETVSSKAFYGSKSWYKFLHTQFSIKVKDLEMIQARLQI
jgi:hypothetical protein